MPSQEREPSPEPRREEKEKGEKGEKRERKEKDSGASRQKMSKKQVKWPCFSIPISWDMPNDDAIVDQSGLIIEKLVEPVIGWNCRRQILKIHEKLKLLIPVGTGSVHTSLLVYWRVGCGVVLA